MVKTTIVWSAAFKIYIIFLMRDMDRIQCPTNWPVLCKVQMNSENRYSIVKYKLEVKAKRNNILTHV